MVAKNDCITFGGAEWRLWTANTGLEVDGSGSLDAMFRVSREDGGLGANTPEEVREIATALLSQTMGISADRIVIDFSSMSLERETYQEPDPAQPWLMRTRVTGVTRVSINGYIRKGRD